MPLAQQWHIQQKLLEEGNPYLSPLHSRKDIFYGFGAGRKMPLPHGGDGGVSKEKQVPAQRIRVPTQIAPHKSFVVKLLVCVGNGLGKSLFQRRRVVVDTACPQLSTVGWLSQGGRFNSSRFSSPFSY